MGTHGSQSLYTHISIFIYKKVVILANIKALTFFSQNYLCQNQCPDSFGTWHFGGGKCIPPNTIRIFRYPDNTQFEQIECCLGT